MENLTALQSFSFWLLMMKVCVCGSVNTHCQKWTGTVRDVFLLSKQNDAMLQSASKQVQDLQ